MCERSRVPVSEIDIFSQIKNFTTISAMVFVTYCIVPFGRTKLMERFGGFEIYRNTFISYSL